MAHGTAISGTAASIRPLKAEKSIPGPTLRLTSGSNFTSVAKVMPSDGGVVSAGALASVSTKVYASIVIVPTPKMPSPTLIAVAPDGMAGVAYVAWR